MLMIQACFASFGVLHNQIFCDYFALMFYICQKNKGEKTVLQVYKNIIDSEKWMTTFCLNIFFNGFVHSVCFHSWICCFSVMFRDVFGLASFLQLSSIAHKTEKINPLSEICVHTVDSASIYSLQK